MTRFWVGVASRDHVLAAVQGQFCQVNHGRKAPLIRVSLGDGLVYYSPREGMKEGKPVKAFTAIGAVIDDAPYLAEQSETFRPYRRHVDYRAAQEAEIGPLLDRLSFTQGGQNFGLVLRRGFFEIPQSDYSTIAQAMGAVQP